jgi:hypothetical protein
MSDDQTITGMRARQQMAVTRARAAAERAGYRTEDDIRAFTCGALWLLKEVTGAFTLTPKDPINLADLEALLQPPPR